MITGINTDIKFDGTIYHVQTEEKEPLIETLVYLGGAILQKKSYDYIQKYGNSLSESEIRKLVEKQHKDMLVSIKNGLLAKTEETDDPKKPIEKKLNISLDELIIKNLTIQKNLK